ncbi:MAG: hypothetical protein MJA82_19215 [Clostridia bacterium]|nr:hypothetical protein [Clostridia bacterium]
MVDTKKEKDTCTAFCPVCKSDTAFLNNECVCKNRDCNWYCDKCRKK